MKPFMNIKREDFKAFMKEHGDDPRFPKLFAQQAAVYAKTEVLDTMMAPLALDVSEAKDGESGKIFVEDGYDAVVVDSKGRSIAQRVDGNELDPPETKVDALLVFRNSDLRRGHVRPLEDHKKVGEKLVRGDMDARCLTALLAAVPTANRVACSGGALTETAAKEAVTIIEDHEKSLGSMFARARVVNFDLADFDLSDKVKEDLNRRGVVAAWMGANIVKTAKVPVGQVLFTPDEKVGKCTIVDFDVSPYYGSEPGTTALYIEMTAKIGVGRPQLLARVDIT